MNIAVIFAGGTGSRMNTKSRPKQFLELHGKPIIIYTLEKFENHPLIDSIVVVCLKTWISFLNKLIKKYNFTKICSVISGGETGQQSIYNGLCEVERLYDTDSVVLIHDGVRPLIDEDTITNNINCVLENGNAITVAPAIETITLKENKNEVGKIIDRSKCQMAKAPQSFLLKDILDCHRRAQKDNYTEAIDSASLFSHYGHKLYTVIGSNENIKITTPADFFMFRAFMDAKENSQIFC